MTLRNATEIDLPAIVEIYNATIPGRMVTADTEPVSIEDRVPWFRAHNPRTRPIWVVDDPVNGRVCAWLSFSSFYGRPAYNPTAEISIYVAETARRQGLGKLLLREAPRPRSGLRGAHLARFHLGTQRDQSATF